MQQQRSRRAQRGEPAVPRRLALRQALAKSPGASTDGLETTHTLLCRREAGLFQRAAKSPQYAVECCSMLGLCFLEKGMPQLAIKWYQRGLEIPNLPEEAFLGMLYDLATSTSSRAISTRRCRN